MIGIMSAMPEEIQALLNELTGEKKYTKGRRTYYCGTLFNKEVVLVFSRIGKVASATTATQLINDFNLSELIFTGAAGALDPKLNIGDIVIGEDLVQYDMNAMPLFNRFEIPLLNKTIFKTDSHKRGLLAKSCLQFLKEYHHIIIEDEAKKLRITEPKVVVGHIASGDQFVTQDSQVRFLKDTLPTMVCAEMEGAAVAQVCYEYDIPFSIIRTISDNTNEDSPVDFPLFIDKIASKYALQIFKNYFQMI